MQYNENDWRAKAACIDMGPDLFFSTADEDIARAKKVCASCIVRIACSEFAISGGQDYGVWGGYEPEERKRISRMQKSAARRAVRYAPTA